MVYLSLFIYIYAIICFSILQQVFQILCGHNPWVPLGPYKIPKAPNKSHLQLTRKTNMSHEKGPSEKGISSSNYQFSVDMLVFRGIIKLPIGKIKQCKCMVNLKDFPEKQCIAWIGNIMTLFQGGESVSLNCFTQLFNVSQALSCEVSPMRRVVLRRRFCWPWPKITARPGLCVCVCHGRGGGWFRTFSTYIYIHVFIYFNVIKSINRGSPTALKMFHNVARKLMEFSGFSTCEIHLHDLYCYPCQPYLGGKIRGVQHP